MANLSPVAFIPPALFAIIGGVFWFGLTRDNPDELTSQFIGSPAPELAVIELSGPLPELGGEVTLVNFWASWCGPCRVEHPTLMALAAEGIPIIGINYKDDPEDALNFLTELGNPYTTMGADTTGRTGINWGLYGVPETFVLNAQGEVMLRFPGPITPNTLAQRIRPALEAAR